MMTGYIYIYFFFVCEISFIFRNPVFLKQS